MQTNGNGLKTFFFLIIMMLIPGSFFTGTFVQAKVIADHKYKLGLTGVACAATMYKAAQVYKKETIKLYEKEAVKKGKPLSKKELEKKYTNDYSYEAFLKAYARYLKDAFIGSYEWQAENALFCNGVKITPFLLAGACYADYTINCKKPKPGPKPPKPEPRPQPVVPQPEPRPQPVVPQPEPRPQPRPQPEPRPIIPSDSDTDSDNGKKPVIKPLVRSFAQVVKVLNPRKIDCCICVPDEDNQPLQSSKLSCGHDICDNCLEQIFIKPAFKVVPMNQDTLKNIIDGIIGEDRFNRQRNPMSQKSFLGGYLVGPNYDITLLDDQLVGKLNGFLNAAHCPTDQGAFIAYIHESVPDVFSDAGIKMIFPMVVESTEGKTSFIPRCPICRAELVKQD